MFTAVLNRNQTPGSIIDNKKFSIFRNAGTNEYPKTSDAFRSNSLLELSASRFRGLIFEQDIVLFKYFILFPTHLKFFSCMQGYLASSILEQVCPLGNDHKIASA